MLSLPLTLSPACFSCILSQKGLCLSFSSSSVGSGRSCFPSPASESPSVHCANRTGGTDQLGRPGVSSRATRFPARLSRSWHRASRYDNGWIVLHVSFHQHFCAGVLPLAGRLQSSGNEVISGASKEGGLGEGRLGNRAAQTREVKDCAQPARAGNKRTWGAGGCTEASGTVLAAQRRTRRMRLAVGALLACAVLGECGRGEAAQSCWLEHSLQPGRPPRSLHALLAQAGSLDAWVPFPCLSTPHPGLCLGL